MLPVLHSSSPWIIYFVTGCLSLLISLTYFIHPSTLSPLATTCLSSVSMSLFLLLCLSIWFLDSHISEIIWCLSFSAWFISLSIILSRSIHVVTNGKIRFSLWLIFCFFFFFSTHLFILKEISPGCPLKGLMLKLKLQYFGHFMRRADSLEKTLMLGLI